ncbi:MAG: DJ-1/PfpI family protein [Candidatus Hydrogenedentes bacterium]|nr:DJ-1/PfpI family protein [Candidatus Hydrogenedentota bacterium]
MSKVLVPLAQGCEELEAITIIDLLRRADVKVVTAGLTKEPVTSSHGVTIVPDMTLDEALKGDYDMVVLPGGLPGADNLKNDDRIVGLVKKMADGGKFACAICAAPIVLAKAGVIDGKKATSYPGFLDKMNVPGMTYTGSAVECDGKIVTSRGPGTAMDFALTLVEKLKGATVRQTVEKALVRN